MTHPSWSMIAETGPVDVPVELRELFITPGFLDDLEREQEVWG